jgi:hypothetical protein
LLLEGQLFLESAHVAASIAAPEGRSPRDQGTARSEACLQSPSLPLRLLQLASESCCRTLLLLQPASPPLRFNSLQLFPSWVFSPFFQFHLHSNISPLSSAPIPSRPIQSVSSTRFSQTSPPSKVDLSKDKLAGEKREDRNTRQERYKRTWELNHGFISRGIVRETKQQQRKREGKRGGFKHGFIKWGEKSLAGSGVEGVSNLRRSASRSCCCGCALFWGG